MFEFELHAAWRWAGVAGSPRARKPVSPGLGEVVGASGVGSGAADDGAGGSGVADDPAAEAASTSVEVESAGATTV